jgi:hypothetical protein
MVAKAVKEEGLRGFEEATEKRVKRLVVSVEGEEKKGKTSFALSSAGPIALLNFDLGLEGVVEKWIKVKKVWVSEFDYRDATSVKQWEEMWEKMKGAYMEALKSPKVRSVVIDTATEAWELLRLARFGKLTQVMPHHYAIPNAEFRDLIRKAYQHDKNLILVHKMKPEYVGDKSTGRLVRSGYGDTPYLVQLSLKVYRDPESSAFGVKVLSCRHNGSLEGTEFPEPMNTFPCVAAEVWEGTTAEDWE